MAWLLRKPPSPATGGGNHLAGWGGCGGPCSYIHTHIYIYVYDVSMVHILVLVFEPNALTSEAPVDLRLQMNTPLTWGFPEGVSRRESRSLDGPHQKNDGKSTNFQWVNPLFLWAIFNSYVKNYQRVIWGGNYCQFSFQSTDQMVWIHRNLCCSRVEVDVPSFDPTIVF